MNAGEMFYLISQHLRRQDIERDVFNRILATILPSLFRRFNFYSLASHAYLAQSNPWCAVLPEDYYDNISLVVISKERRTVTVTLTHILSINDFITLYGTNDMLYLKELYTPTIPMYYAIGEPAKVFANTETEIPPDEQNLRSVLLYPPMDTSLYQLSLLYYSASNINVPQITDDYEHPLMRKYPEWVLYEVLWRMCAQLRDLEGLQIFKNLADEKFIEAKLAEIREATSPPLSLHLKSAPVKIKVGRGKDATEIGRLVITTEDV